MKKLLAMLLCAIMVLSMFAACGGTTPSTENKGDTNDGEQITITIGIPQSALVTDYYENDFTKWLEEQTGYNIEFELFATASGDYASQLATMTAGGLELPDMLMGFSLGDSVYQKYGEQGYFIDLAPYYNDKEGASKVWWERMELLDEVYRNNILRRITSDDGAMYVFPSVETSMIDTMNYQVWINDEWLDAVGMEKPTNCDELIAVLEAFRDNDPNGNGLKDEIPLIGATNNLSGDTINWLLNMFCYVDDAIMFNIDDNGQVYLPHMTDEYREGLKYINKLVKDGLMNPMAFSIGSKELQPMVTPAEGEPIVGVVVTHPTLGFTQGDEGILAYSCLPLWGNAMINEDQNYRRGFITENAENPDACWNLWMTMCSEEGAIRLRYGNRGEHWDWADEGAESFLGIPAQYKLYEDVWSTQGDDNWRICESTVLINAEQEAAQLTGEEDEVTAHKYQMFIDMRESYANQMANYNPDEKYVCPLLVWSDLEKEECPERSDCSSYISKARSEFGTGVRDPYSDADWAQYLADLEKLQVQKWVTYAQGVYERTIAEQG